MALSQAAKARIPATANTTSTSDPVTASFTCPAGTEMLVLGICVGSNSDRVGGAPTYDGVAMTQRDTNRGTTTGYEVGVEMWELADPPTESSLTISIPNTGGRLIWAYVDAIDGDGAEVEYDTAVGEEYTGTSTDRSITIVTGADGCYVLNVIATGDNSWAPTGQTGTLNYKDDVGSGGGGSQYLIKATSGSQVMEWTGDATGDDVAMIAVSYKPVSSGISGAANITLAAFTSTATGAVDVAGAANITLANVTLTATGNSTGGISGAANITLAALTSTAAGKVDVAGALSKTLDALTSTAAGVVEVSGAASINLAAFTSTAAGVVEVSGAASITLANVTLTATGNATGGISGAANITLAAFTSTAAGTVEVSGAASINLAAFTSTATAQVYIEGAASISLDAFTLSAAGTSGGAISGALNVTLDPFTVAAAGISAHAGGSLSSIAVGRRPLEPALQSYKYRRLR